MYFDVIIFAICDHTKSDVIAEFLQITTATALVHWKRNGNEGKNNLMMSLHKKQMREGRKMKKKGIHQTWK